VPSRKSKRPLHGVRRTIPAALCSAGMMAAWLAAPVASAQASALGAAPPGVIHSVANVPGEKAALAYWTPARLRAAKPADMVIAGAKPRVLPAMGKQPGKPGHVAGGLPDGRGPAVIRRARAITPEASPYPYPYYSFTPSSTLWSTYPYAVNGKLFFTNNGGGFVCSATAVASASGASNENEIWTAGHCVVNTGSNNRVVDSSAVFIPAYNGNVSNFDPYGKFVWNGSWETSSGWYYNSDLTEDEAAMRVGTSSTTGRTLGQAVGWDGFAWNQPVNEQFAVFGYPAVSPYNGLNMVEDIASTAGQDTISGADATEPIAIGDPMTGGSSGGAWNIFWTRSGPGYIDGHNDYKYTSQPLAMYSPYQDALSNEVRCFGKASC
jgi:hypothetical protein